jgi:hypothetical protein
MKFILITCLLFGGTTVLAQFHPPAGQPGTSAIHKDSSIITAWATGCTVTRGYQNITNTAAGYASAGTDSNAIGTADGAGVVSLGDGGIAVLTFSSGIYDGSGYDFCVFENSFSNDFLELAFVEVSSDGINYFRFASTSLVQDTAQTGSFGLTDATLINNLAGKYGATYGTPFDLQELSGIQGLDINNITHVRVIDVVGIINSVYSGQDQYSKDINDPWPTEFPSGGFDLDAIGVIHQNPKNISEADYPVVSVYPQPCTNEFFIEGLDLKKNKISLYGLNGKKIELQQQNLHNQIRIKIENATAGMYMLICESAENVYSFKIIVE